LALYQISTSGSDANDGVLSPVRTVRRLRDVTSGALTAGDEVAIIGDHRAYFRLGDYGQGISNASRFKVSAQNATIQTSTPLNPKNRLVDFNCEAAWSLDAASWLDFAGGASLSTEGTGATIDSTGNPQGVGSASFDGSGSLSRTAFSTPKAFTVAFWVKLTDVTGTQSIISQWSDTSGKRDWEIYKSSGSGKLRFRYSLDGIATESDKEFGPVLAQDQWYFISCIIRPLTIDTYVFQDGDLISGGLSNPGSRTLTGTINSGADKFAIGSKFTGAGAVSQGAKGSVDGVMYFEEALEDWEIEEICLRWIDGQSRPWVDNGGGVWEIPTLNTLRSTGPRSPFRLYESGDDLVADGMVANVGSVTSINER
jgi:hypothetical protein